MSTQAKTTQIVKVKTTGSTMADSCICYLCQKEISSTSSARNNHKWDNHDGWRRRIFPLKCQWCDIKPMITRKDLAKHLLSRCEAVLRLRFPLSCPFCDAVKERGREVR
ncbi:hypothetical protein BG011_006539, partial [Mortierella polycephala]